MPRRRNDFEYEENLRRQNSSNSPFLRLPGEIREMIYRAAFVCPEPIDLCPDVYVPDKPSDPECAKRMQKNESITGFRSQESLSYFRREMAPGLLRASWQIYHEAYRIFWSENTFRFTEDVTWLYIRRFFLTIGDAVAMIRHIEIIPPHEDFARKHCPTVKNHPKLGMAKGPSFFKRRDFWEETMSNVSIVCIRLEKYRMLRSLKLTIPRGYTIDIGWLFWHKEFAPALFDYKLPDWLDMSVVLERGSRCAHPYTLDELRGYLDVTCMPGSLNCCLSPFSTLYFEEERTALEKYDNHAAHWEYLIGVESLYFEPEDETRRPVYGRGAHWRNTKRNLQSFGGCRFVACTGCNDCAWVWGYQTVCFRVESGAVT